MVMMLLSWRYNKFTDTCKPPARLEFCEWREIPSRDQVELGENVGDDILASGQQSLIQFRDELICGDALIILREPGIEAKIEFAPGDCLGREIREAGFDVCAIVVRQCVERLGDRGGASNGFLQCGKLVAGNVDGYLDAGFPAAFLHVEDATLRGGSIIDRFRTEEKRHAIGSGVRRRTMSHGGAL